ncbi:hypothetical protein [[Eubacterium] cellulosolvens]
MEELTLYFEVCVIGISLLLFVMTLLSYRLSKNPKVLILSLAFLIFAVKIIMLLAAEYLDPIQWFGTVNALLIFDFVIVLVIYFSLIKK